NSNTSSTKGLLLSISLTGPLPTYTETYQFDSINRVSSRTISQDNKNYTVTYQYDNGGNTTQLIYPSGRVVNVNVDGAGRVSSITDPASVNYISGITYNAAGKVTGDMLGNGIAESYGYDSNRLQLISQTAGTGGSLLNLNYSYQASAGQMGAGTTAGNCGQFMAIGNNSSIHGLPESLAYTYDLQRRLLTSSETDNGTTTQRRFVYDRWGNRTAMWDSTSGGNQLQGITLQQSGGIPTNKIQTVTTTGTVTYTYDAAGNVTGDGVHTYQYDGENRITTVDNGNTASYAYNHNNERFRKVVGTAITHYIWEGNQPIAEHNGSTGAQIVDYVYMNNRLLGEGPGTTISGNGSFLYQMRYQMRQRSALRRYENFVRPQARLTIGEEAGETGSQEKHHFTSYESDSETGLDYAINREYSPGLGRFLASDSSAHNEQTTNPQTWNRYSYCLDDPANQEDQTGL